MGNSICWYFLVKCTQNFSRFHSKKPRTNLPSCIQIPIALSFADVPCGVPSLLCFEITGPVIAIRMPQHAPTLDSTCSSGILTPQPPALSWSRCWIFLTGPLQPFPPRTLPKLCGRNPGFPNKTTVCRSLMLAAIQEMLGCLKCHKQSFTVTWKR